jgi:tetratricopeptide (TPR) repeat protein
MPSVARLTVLVLLVLGVVFGAFLLSAAYSEREYSRLLRVGDTALSAGDSFAAVEAFSGALAFRPDSMVAHLRRGEAYRAQQRHDEAVRDWKAASRLAPDAPQPLVALGDLAEALGDARQAADWFGQAADILQDRDPALLYRLALARYRSGTPGTALDPVRRALSRQDASAATHYLFALIARDVGQESSAIDALEAALKLQPDFVSAHEELADLYRAEGRRVDEMAQLQALAASGQSWRSVAIGLAEARQGRLEAAVGTLSGVAARAPGDSAVLVALGRVHLARAERDRDASSIARARDVLEQALGGTARRSEGLALYGRALYLAGETTEAERILREAVSTSPVAAEAFAYLADAAERAGHALAARDALLSLDALQGDTVAPAVRLSRARRIGDLSLRAGDPETAAHHLARATGAGGDDALTLGLLAEARWRTGERDEARTLLARALSLRPDDARLATIARLIR